MPAAFTHAGWLVSLLILMALAFMSYLTTTFVIEAMAAANAMVHRHAVRHFKKVIKKEEMQISPINCQSELVADLMTDEVISSALGHDERLPLLLNTVDSVDYYSITERIELGKMASLFFNKVSKRVPLAKQAEALEEIEAMKEQEVIEVLAFGYHLLYL
ncbi:transmembrane protein 104-like [Limulus polyphemus]|uniref:Transmembrane protein 104-like n=1 Tax=Limulus polyphemus TaxID=6850 RepID=A0ABM1BR61_LIMPO|nr:transmembrane protein 104-like [Limulus polyphemus]